MTDLKFQFGNVVVVEDELIGVIVKSWVNGTYEVYVRSFNSIHEYREADIKHYVFSKELLDEQLEFYN